MPDHEFDNYLTLLAGLLRLDGKQREEIAGELRAHLEDRLDELLARGVSRQEAVRQALEDFGDAAGLAADFVAISRGRRRRWIMRFATASVAAILLIAAGIVTFWPGTNAGPGAATLVAQDPNGSQHKETKTANAEPGENGATQLADKLGRRIDVDFNEVPLADCIAFLSDTAEVQFYVKRNKLEEAGITSDTPITKNLKKVRLGTLLDLMLDELNLVYVEKDELLVITTPEDAEATMEVRVYDCRDLVSMPSVSTGQIKAPKAQLGGSGEGFGERPGTSPFPGGEAGGSPAIPDGSRGAKDEAVPGGVLPQLGGVATPPGPGIPQGMNPLAGGGGFGMGMGMGGDEVVGPLSPAAQLISIITATVDPNSWTDVGGPGSIAEYNGLLVISQSARTHAKIEKVLDMLRKAADLPQTKTPRVVR